MNRVFTHRVLVLSLSTTLALTTPVVAPAAPQARAADTDEATAACDADSRHAFTRGHQDLALLQGSNGIEFIARDDESHQDYASGEFYVEVSKEFDESGAGDVPSHGWQIPQTQDETVPWVGFNTSHIDDESVVSDATLSVQLHSAPADGRMVGYQTQLGGADIVFDSDDPGAAWNYPDHAHSHVGIVFTEPGAYAVTFTFHLNDGSEHSIDVPFLVGGADPSELCELTWDSESGDGEVSGGTANRPQQLAKDINDTSKAISQLDKTMDKTFKEADTLVNGDTPQDAKKSTENTPRQNRKESRRDSTDNKDGEDTAASPAQDSRPASGGQRANTTRPQHASQAQPPQSGGGSRGGSRGASGEKEAKPTTQRSTGKHSRSAEARDKEDATLADTQPIQPLSYGAPMVGFWAGFLAGMGALALLFGIGLFVAVQFFRPRRKD